MVAEIRILLASCTFHTTNHNCIISMKNFYAFTVCLLVAATGMAQVPVTFQVDMNNETVSADGVHIAGGFQGWDPAATMMLDDDMDGIFEVTLDLPADSTYEFKFINGMAWDFVEDVPPTCQVEVTGNDNRFLTIDADATEASYHVCYGSCAACGMTTVRFRVDMTVESAVSPNGVHVAGNFQGWDPAGSTMTDADEDGIWEAWASFYPDSIEDGMLIFKFINGNSWSNPNEALAGEACADDFGNRILAFEGENMVLVGDESTLAAPCFNSCGTCVSPTQVTLRVDMTTQETVSVNGVHVAGSFQGWSPSANPLSDDDGDGIWEATIGIAPGDIQFKFINGNDWSGNGDGNVDNELVVGDCAAEGSDNRALTVGSEDIVYEVCYNSCEAGCVENPDPADVTFRVDMTEEEVSATGVWVIGNFTNPNWQTGALQMTDDDTDGVYEVTVNISGSATILYKFTNGDPTTGDNGVDFVEESGILLDEEGNEIANFEADGCGLPNGFGAYNRIHERSGEPEILDAVCFNKCSTCVVSVDEITATEFNAYPNPFNATLTLDIVPQVNNTQLFIADLSGRVVLEQNIVAGTERVVLNTENLKAGSYIVQWLNRGAAQARVFVKH